MHAYLLSMSSPPNSDAILRQKLWLPRQFAAQVISAALEFQQLLDIQAPGHLHDPDSSGDVLQGVRYKNGMVMLLTAVKGSLTPPPALPYHGWRDIVGIFALLAAEEFKYLLDIQAPGSLFFPAGLKKSRSDARETATYKRAANLLSDARLQVLQATELSNENAQRMTIGAGLDLVESLMRGAFDCVRDPRSDAYKLGARELLKYRTLGISLRCPYSLGTAESDAFYAGKDEGCQIWRQHLAAPVQCAETTAGEVR